MKEENKKEIKKGVLTGAGTAAGAVIGAVVENSINAADTEVKNIPDAEIVDAIVDELPQIPEEDITVSEEESVSNEAVVTPEPRISRPIGTPEHNTTDSQINETPTVEEVEIVGEAEAVIESGTESYTTFVEEPDVDEDIMVVSVDSEDEEDEEVDIYNASQSSADLDDVSVESGEVPDYVDLKDNDLSVGSSIMSAIDMPDYVNDANIESFTDNV